MPEFSNTLPSVWIPQQKNYQDRERCMHTILHYFRTTDRPALLIAIKSSLFQLIQAEQHAQRRGIRLSPQDYFDLAIAFGKYINPHYLENDPKQIKEHAAIDPTAGSITAFYEMIYGIPYPEITILSHAYDSSVNINEAEVLY